MKHTQFCQELLSFFEIKSEPIVNLVVALASNVNANSPTELANNQTYKYQYSSICDAIHHILPDKTTNRAQKQMELENDLWEVLANYLPEKQNPKFWVINVDASAILRQHSPTLRDKEYVHVPNSVIPGNKPIGIGQRLSTVGLPIRNDGISWNLPLSMLQIPFDEKSSSFAAQQIENLVKSKILFGEDLIIIGGDCGYNRLDYIYPTFKLKNLVNILRMASNRKVWLPFKGETIKRKGPKTKYGKVFKLNKLETQTRPDTSIEFETKFSNARECVVHINQWNNLLLRGKGKKIMYNKPFNLVSVQITDKQTGQLVFKNTLWLTVWGERSNELTLNEIYDCYRLRYDIEFFFRFGKQKLMLNSYQTPDVNHQENWFHVVQLAYWLLFLCRTQGGNIVQKWEKYLPIYNDQNFKELDNQKIKTPTQTQRAMVGIMNEFAKNHFVPKTRNKSSGRKKGKKQTPRERYKVVKKGKNLKI